ncbi:MAG: V-type ATPase subunit [Methanomicrobiaceae archaeon]|nr:V-type ATPase subunit [Methanomicrobiaceae archaeon]MDD5419122.1 V-type ATPase subunit [Methanomicrobiaceae archaeon]
MIPEIAGLPAGGGIAPVILLALGLGVAAAVMVVFFIPVLEIARFVHPIAYVKATGTPFVDRREIYPLAGARDPGTLLATLRARGILEDIPGDASRLARLLSAWHLQSLRALERAAPAAARPLLDALALGFEIDTLKSAIIRKHMDSAPSEIESALLPAGRVDAALLRRIAGATGMEEVAELVGEFPYGPAFRDALPRYLADWRIMPLTAALNRFYYEELGRAVLRSSRHLQGALASYVGARIDLANATAVLSAKVTGTCREEVMEYLLPGGLTLDLPVLEHMAEAPTVREALALLEGTAYRPVVAALIPAYEAESDIVPIVSALERAFLEHAAALGSAYPLTVGPIIEHLAGLEYERRNLHVALTGVLTGVPPERIEPLLTVRRGAA